MPEKKEDDQRYKPGMASLAVEVLRSAIQHGVKPESLQKSIWAEFLLYHRKMMAQGGIKHGAE